LAETIVDMQDAQARLPELIERVENGDSHVDGTGT